MKSFAAIVCAVLALSLFPATSGATKIFSFEGTTPDTLVDFSFKAELTIAGDNLTVVLENLSNSLIPPSPTLNPNDLLTSFYFEIIDGLNNRPTLTYVSASGDVYLADKDNVDTLATAAADIKAVNPGDDTWQFKDGLTLQFADDVLSFGIGTAGNNSLMPNGFDGNIVDGMDYGIYAGDVTGSNLDGKLLVKGPATYNFTGVSGFTEADISDEALFGLGTQPDSTAFVPEPGTFLLACMGLVGLGLGYYGRRRRTRDVRASLPVAPSVGSDVLLPGTGEGIIFARTNTEPGCPPSRAARGLDGIATNARRLPHDTQWRSRHQVQLHAAHGSKKKEEQLMQKSRSHFPLTVTLSLTLVICGLPFHTPSRADVITHFSEFSSDPTDPADLTASALFSITGSDMDITIDNTSNFSVSQLYFNSDEALTGLSFDPLSGADPAWSITGTGASQSLGADGFGMHNWLIDFGSGGSQLSPGITNLSLDMTGVSSEAIIATKFSSPPPGDTAAIGAMKFESGPGGDSAFGSAEVTRVMLREIIDFSGMATSVPFSVDGLDLETGKVLITLDPTADNVFALDDELLQGFIDVTLILEFPEFLFPELLGPDPVIIRIIENGPVTIDPFEGWGGFFFTAVLSGGGMIEEGLFAGLIFENVNLYEGEGAFGSLIVSGDTPVTWTLDGSGTVTFPPSLGGGTEPIDGMGDLNVVPEPSGIVLAALSLCALLAIALRRNRRHRK